MRVRGLRAVLVPALGLAAGAGAGCMNTPKAAPPPVVKSTGPALMPAPAKPAAATPAAVSRSQSPEATATLATPAPAAPTPGEGEEVLVRPLARVNGRPIYESELKDATAQVLMSVPQDERSRRYEEIRAAQLQDLIERELVIQELEERLKKAPKDTMDKLKQAATNDFDRRMRDFRRRLPPMSDEQFRQLMAAQGVSIEGMKRHLERNFMKMEYVRNRVFGSVQKINLRDMRDYYEEHADEFRVEDQVEWQDLFIASSNFPTPDEARAHAEKVRQRAASGADFAALCKECDNGDSRFRDGAGIGTRRGEIRPAAAEEVLFSLKPGEVGPLVELGSGYHVVKVVKRVYAGVHPFDEAMQQEVRRRLQNVIAEREMKKFFDELRRRAAIEILVDE
jgi:peptidyl-prolyl cis-trans isomerase SurA